MFLELIRANNQASDQILCLVRNKSDHFSIASIQTRVSHQAHSYSVIATRSLNIQLRVALENLCTSHHPDTEIT